MGGRIRKRRTHSWPTRLPPISEVLDRYAESALVSAIRLRRYWIMQGDSPERAREGSEASYRDDGIFRRPHL